MLDLPLAFNSSISFQKHINFSKSKENYENSISVITYANNVVANDVVANDSRKAMLLFKNIRIRKKSTTLKRKYYNSKWNYYNFSVYKSNIFHLFFATKQRLRLCTDSLVIADSEGISHPYWKTQTKYRRFYTILLI